MKLFHGAEKYGSTSGYSRDQRRYIEKENKKLRDAKRKEYSDTVRSLAMYLKKRDPRYLAWKRATEEESAKEKSTNNCNKKQSYQSKTSEMLPEWAQINEADYLAYFKSFRASESESEEIEVQEDLNLEQPIPLKSTKYVQIDYYCEACRKSFKSESQWSNHEKSNKHFKCIKELKRKFRKEEKMLKRLQKENKDNDLDESSDLIEQSIGSDEDDQELLSAESEDEDKNEDEKGSEDEDEDEKRSEDEDEDEKRSEIIISEPDSDVDLETLLGKLEIERNYK